MTQAIGSARTDLSSDAARSIRAAAIDVGTNSLRLVVAELLPDGSHRVLDDEKVVTRLGRGMATSDRLADEPMQQTAQAIAHLKTIADGYGVDRLDAIATCAVREATNGDEFVAMVHERAGLELRVIDAQQEAKLAHRSVRHGFDLRDMNTAIADIGGGSTEIVLSCGPVIEQICPVPSGAVRLAERFGLGDIVSDAQLKLVRRHLRDLMHKCVGKPMFEPQLVIGTGGTFTTLASISMQRDATRRRNTDMLASSARGYELPRSEVTHLMRMMAAMPLEVRARVPGLQPERADIIVAGLAIIEAVMTHLNVDHLRVHDQGIRAGLLLEMFDEMRPAGATESDQPTDRLHSVRKFARTCQYPEAHSEHVAQLAVQIFDQLSELLPEASSWATRRARVLLESAAVLHEVGCYINYDRHHKHSYHLITHSDLHGFTQREREVVANVARYHRRAFPKKKHANFAKLSQADRTLVSRLAAILRIANGLDRTHTQGISRIDLACQSDRVIFSATATQEPVVDLWGAQRKSEMFSRVFKREPVFAWASAETPGDV